MAKQKYYNGTTWEVIGTDAEKVSLKDTDDLFTATDVEGALEEVKNAQDAHMADYVRQGGYAVTTGTSTAYAITLDPAPSAYADGQQFIMLPHVDCGATPTLNINGLGASTILKQDGTAIAAGEIKANKPLSLVRVGSNFFIRSSGGGGIKSIQSGSVTVNTVTKNVTISAVDLTKAIVLVNYVSGGASDQINNLVMGQLTTATNLEFSIGAVILPSIAYWTVIEFNNVKSLQKGVATFTTSTKDVAISAITVNKSIAFISYKSSSGSSGGSLMTVAPNITTTTNLRLIQYSNSENKSVAWQVIEFN